VRRIVAFLSALVIVFSITVGLPVNASEKSTYIKKIVSLVYDDSGSMKNDNKWAYANYAVQSFCGMLNSEDQLYITYMSRAQLQEGYKPEQIDLSSGGIQKSVDAMRNHDEDEDTPFKSVELAFKKLQETKVEDENAQYWLVVITDGVFDEIYRYENDKRKKFLNEKFISYAGIPMPNGSRVQTNFLSIGGVVAPDNNENLDINTYSVDTADKIIAAMSTMAHKVSGRTRVDSQNIKKISDNTIEITSSLPLLNIAVLSQKTDSVISKVTSDKGDKMRINRNISVSYPGYSELQGRIYLIGGKKEIMDEGKYKLTFSGDVSPEQLVIMLEPAIETRIFIEHEGKTYSSISDINKLTNRENITVSYKVYKIGEDKEIPQDEFADGTKFNLALYEDEQVVLSNDGKSMTLKEHTLSDKEIRIKADIQVDGFNPIGSSVAFVPAQYGSGDEFSVKAEFLDDNQKVKYSNISSNSNMGIVFTVYESGNPVTDPEKVKATLPEITVDTPGNEGEVKISDDGRIIFIPKKAQLPSPDSERFNVVVKCTIGGNKTVTKEYTVLVSDYEIEVLNDNIEIVKTSLFDNKECVTFCIRKNGTQLKKTEFSGDFKIDLGEKFSKLKTEVTVSDDGIVSVRPFSEQHFKFNFFSWWINWYKYFSAKSGDMAVNLSHELGNAQANVKIKGENLLYQILNVYIPLILELILLALLITWLILIITKPRFTETAKLYVGTVRYNRLKQNHILTGFESENLKEYNKVKKGNGRLKFKRDADIIEVMGVNVRADFGDRIFCEDPQPWYKVSVEPIAVDADTLRTPEQLEQYFSKHRKLEIEEISALEAIDKESAKNMGPNNSRNVKYIVIPDGVGANESGLMRIDGRLVIKSGKIFIYKD